MIPISLNRTGLWAALAFSVTWATTGVTVKLLPHISPAMIVAFRCFFAFMAFLPFLFSCITIWKIKDQAPDQGSLTLLVFFLGAIFFSMLSLQQPDAWPVVLQIIQSEHLWLLLSLGVLSTAIPTITYSLASQLLPPLVTTSFRLLTPLTAIFLAFLFAGEVPSGWAVPGGALILLGLVLMVLLKGKK